MSSFAFVKSGKEANNPYPILTTTQIRSHTVLEKGVKYYETLINMHAMI